MTHWTSVPLNLLPVYVLLCHLFPNLYIPLANPVAGPDARLLGTTVFA